MDSRHSARKRKAEGSRSGSYSDPNLPYARSSVCVPVNEDFLFEVNIEDRELAPVYWLGAIYEGWHYFTTNLCVGKEADKRILVRRGTWFFQEGSNLRPCEENLAAQLEEVCTIIEHLSS